MSKKMQQQEAVSTKKSSGKSSIKNNRSNTRTASPEHLSSASADDPEVGPSFVSDESAALDIVGGHQLGKQRVLARFMSLFGEVLSCIEDIPYSVQGKVSEIDFSECALSDEEFCEARDSQNSLTTRVCWHLMLLT